MGGFLLDADLVASFDHEAARLWLWHAVEELAHRSVAFDTYQAVFHDNVMRKRVMRLLSPSFINMIAYATVRLFWQDRRQSLPQVKANVMGVYRLTKMMVSLVPEYLAYYKADFHPSEQNVDELLAKWRHQLGSDAYAVAGFASGGGNLVS